MTTGKKARRATAASTPTLMGWQRQAIEAVGEVIEFWGFKRNQGRVWAYLYLKGEPASAGEIQKALRLSKGAVSMVTRELESWTVVRRLHSAAADVRLFRANTEVLSMIGRVLQAREAAVIARAREELTMALQEAERQRAAAAVIARLRGMVRLAVIADSSLKAFLKSAQFSFARARRLLLLE